MIRLRNLVEATNRKGYSKEVRILNRKLVWHDGIGVSDEADPKHAEVL